ISINCSNSWKSAKNKKEKIEKVVTKNNKITIHMLKVRPKRHLRSRKEINGCKINAIIMDMDSGIMNRYIFFMVKYVIMKIVHKIKKRIDCLFIENSFLRV